YRKAGSTTTGFVNLVYMQTAGRMPSALEMFVALQFILPKTGRGGIAWQLLNSVEYRTKVILGYFHNVLQRHDPQNAAERQQGNLQLHQLVYSSLGLKAIRIQLESTKEFFDFAV